MCASGKWVVLVCGKDEARVMKRAGNGGKWACARVLEVSSDGRGVKGLGAVLTVWDRCPQVTSPRWSATGT